MALSRTDWAIVLGGVGCVVLGGRLRAQAPADDPGSDDDMNAFGVPSQAVRDFADAIATAEGFYVDGSLSQRLHNPGDLKWGTPTLTPFATDAAGWAALYRQLQKIEQGMSRQYALTMTLAQMGETWAPATDQNEPGAWAANVARALQRAGYPVTVESQLVEIFL